MRVVVAGSVSLYAMVGHSGFPLAHQSRAKPRWMACGVSGAAVHVATVLRRLGADVELCTAVADDAAGAAIRYELAERGLLGPGVITGEASSLGVALADAGGRRLSLPYPGGVDQASYPFDLLAAAARRADLLVLDNGKLVRPLVASAAALGVPIASDVHVIDDVESQYSMPWLQAARIVFCSHEQLPDPPARWVARLLACYPACDTVGVGLGARGALLGLRDGRLIHAAADPPLGVVNTAGAGDALFGTYLHGRLRGQEPARALAAAVTHAAWQIGDRLPSRAALDEQGLTVLHRNLNPRVTHGRWDE